MLAQYETRIRLEQLNVQDFSNIVSAVKITIAQLYVVGFLCFGVVFCFMGFFLV